MCMHAYAHLPAVVMKPRKWQVWGKAHSGIIGIWVQSITQQVYLTMFIEDENIITCFGLIRPSSGLHPKGIRDL